MHCLKFGGHATDAIAAVEGILAGRRWKYPKTPDMMAIIHHGSGGNMQAIQLSGEQLDHWVAKARGIPAFHQNGELQYNPGHNLPPRKWNPTRYWSQGGPIIEEQKIDLNWDTEGTLEWSASIDPDILAHGSSVLEAAMRAYVISVFGPELPGEG
jgi:hypothetical protein